MTTLQKENIGKNVIIAVVLAALYPHVQTSLLHTPIVDDIPLAGDILVAVSILIVTACFGNFAFTYEKIAPQKLAHRLIAHVTTGLLMLLIGLSLEMTSVLASVIVGNVPVLHFSLLILYVASIFYDIWDVERLNL